MPYMKKVGGKSVRDYQAELAWEKKNGNQRGKDRAKRNTARRQAGLKVGDPREADHKKSLTEGGSNEKSNIRIVSSKTNAKKEVARKKREAKR